MAVTGIGGRMNENAWNVRRLEEGLLVNRAELFRLGTAILFIVLIMLFALSRGPVGPSGVLLVAAAMIGGYMALNIGANDVANTAGALRKDERKGLQKIQRIELVKRTLLLRIAAAWVITVPAAALLSAMIFFMLRGALLP